MSDTKKVAIYIRVNHKEQSALDFQKELLTTYCNSKGIQNYECYIDYGYANINLERPAIQKLILHAKEGKISTCIVCDLSRLSRSAKKALHLIKDILVPNGVNVISLKESLDTSTPVGKFVIETYIPSEIERWDGLCRAIKK